MRILHMIPDIGIANGVMSVILNYAKAMPGDVKFDVLYFHETENTRQAEIEALGGKVYKVDAPSPMDIVNRKFKPFFEEHKAEWIALHIHAPHFAVFIAPEAKKARINKICVHCHTTEFSLKGNTTRNKLLSLYAKYFINDKFACSKSAGKLWYGKMPFVVINNAIDIKKYAYNERERYKLRKDMELYDSFVIGHIGRTDIPQKNHKFLFNVFAELKKIRSDVKLLLIGAESTDELSDLARRLDISGDILYLGFREDVPNLLQACDFFVFPSISEGLPVSVVEAQASGLAVIMSENVTNEVMISDNIYSLSLNDSVYNWAIMIANMINKVSVNNRNAINENLLTSDWNIKKEALNLLNYYKSV